MCFYTLPGEAKMLFNCTSTFLINAAHPREVCHERHDGPSCAQRYQEEDCANAANGVLPGPCHHEERHHGGCQGSKTRVRHIILHYVFDD